MDATLITEWQIREFLGYVASETHRWGLTGNGSERCQRLASDSTVHHYYAALRVFFNWCVGEDFLKQSPLAKIKIRNPEPKVIQPYPSDEITRMLAVCDYDFQHNAKFLGSRNRAIILMLLDTGVRVSELGNINLEDIDTERGWVKVTGKGAKERVVRIGATLKPETVAHTLRSLGNFFCRIAEWEWEEAPNTNLIFQRDIPPTDAPRPRFLDEKDAARFLSAARSHPDLFTWVCGITLLRTGLLKSEFLNLTADCIVQIGSGYWLRVPLVKFRHERYVPLHPEVKQLLEEWTCQQPALQPTDFLFTRHGERIGRGRVDAAVQRIAADASVAGKVTPHRLRHTLATLAINRGMSLESIANLLGHRSLSMTLVYARISNHTVHEEYSAVSQQLEHLCGQPSLLPATAEGPEMRQLRQETHWRLLGNGYCTRPDGVPCEYETICESCSCFVTTRDFLPTLYSQKQDADNKGHTERAHIVNQLIQKVEKSQ